MRLHTMALAVAVLAGTGGPLVAVGQEVAPRARVVRVEMTEFKFTPRNVQVHVGDTVKWTNNGTMIHTSTSNTNVWNSGNLAPGASVSFTFNTTGKFPYHCILHPALMQGTVRVVP
jgi:plastocyanin